MQRLIVGPSPYDHRVYTEMMQRKIFGSVRDYRSENSAFGDGPPVVPKLARAVDVARYKYADRPDVAPHPVWYVVQVHGYINGPADRYNPWFINRPPSPEEQTAQVFIALGCGVNGLLFSDFEWDAALFGPTRRNRTESSTNLNPFAEYDTLSSYEINPGLFNLFNGQRQLPKMYTGFTSRIDAIRRVVDHLRDTILPVYTTLRFAQQMSVYDTGMSFTDFPLVDTLYAEKAERYDTSGSPYVGSAEYDPRGETYIELSRFVPGPNDTLGQHTDAQYLMISNRRTYPNSDSLYADSTLDALRAVAADTSGYTNQDLGFIDVRRPVIVLKNSTTVIADSAIIERIGYEDATRQTVAFGQPVQLSWLDPGWGSLWRIRPVPLLLSDLGTAYNNGIRAENPSSDTLARDRLVVYQRDSVCYLRTVDAIGTWSAEVMLSSPNDTAIVNGKRLGSNFFPSIATCRNNLGATRVVWERRDTLGRHSVESLLLLENPITRLNIAGVVDTQSYRQQLAPPLFLDGPPHLTPVIVGVHDTAGTGGFVVSFANRFIGVDVMAIRELTDGIDTLAWQDTVSIRRVHANTSVDSVCQYPTLAHVPYFQLMNGSSGRLAGTDAEKETDPLTEESLYWYNRLHLAYQQGDGDESVDERIYYHPVGVIFPDASNDPPGLFVGWYEPVTAKIDACSFVHPSIAGDSTRIGVAFEIVESGGGQRNIGLRFRDTAGSNQGTPLKAWETTLYRWGGPLTRAQRFFGLGSIYERPSLTEFPSMDSLSLASNPEGGLTWFQGSSPVRREFIQWAYRYGWPKTREIGDGKHPTMMLVPYRSTNPFEGTGIFHRGTDSTRVKGVNDEEDTVYRYSSRLLNTPGNPIGYFSTITGGSGIAAEANLTPPQPACNRARRMDFGIVFPYGSITHPDDDHHVPGDPPIPPPTPGLPPSFFAPPGNGSTILDTIMAAEKVVRTGLFMIGNDPVTVRRIAGGGDSLSEWLDDYGMDPERSVPANIWVVLELVRGSDSTVLWRSDTIDARRLDTLDDPLAEEVAVPADEVADSGTVAFIRLHGFATTGVVYDLHGGFQFYTVDSTGSGFMKLVHPRIEREATATAGESSLSVQVIPNPAHDRAEVRVRVLNPGRVRLGVYGMLGEKLADLPELEADSPGEYSVEISLSNVRPGVYLLRAESGDQETTAGFNVVR